MNESWFIWGRRVLAAVALVCLVLALFYFSIQVRLIAHVHAELAQVQSDVTALQQQQISQLNVAAARLDDLERTLFGDVVAKLAAPGPGPNRVELWQKNRDAELRGRIATLERRLLRLEAVIQEWR